MTVTPRVASTSRSRPAKWSPHGRVAMQQAIPDAKLVVIPEAGHVSNLERPEQFNEVVREFCLASSPH